MSKGIRPLLLLIWVGDFFNFFCFATWSSFCQLLLAQNVAFMPHYKGSEVYFMIEISI